MITLEGVFLYFKLIKIIIYIFNISLLKQLNIKKLNYFKSKKQRALNLLAPRGGLKSKK